jgi:hypothetical protein
MRTVPESNSTLIADERHDRWLPAELVKELATPKKQIADRGRVRP